MSERSERIERELLSDKRSERNQQSERIDKSEREIIIDKRSERIDKSERNEKRERGVQHSFDNLRDYQISGNEKKFEEIISELKFLSKVKVDQKINVNLKEIIDQSIQNRLYRTLLRDENRNTTLKYVKDVITNAIDQIYFFNSLRDPFYTTLSNIIRQEVMNAKRGIECLARTYSQSDSLSADFESVLTSIEVKLHLTKKNDN